MASAAPGGLAAAARCWGVLETAEGDLAAAFEAYARALGELEAHSYPFERARTLLALGSAHRQAKQKRLARAAIEEALSLFDELGARLWAEKARAELKRISGRRRASENELDESRDARIHEGHHVADVRTARRGGRWLAVNAARSERDSARTAPGPTRLLRREAVAAAQAKGA